jgi:alkylated DNA repair dioxygenase AlkB
MNEDPQTSEVIRPGIVLIRRLLDDGEQRRIIDIVKRHGGLQTENAWNFFGQRGRTFDVLSNYPPEDETFLRSCFEKMKHQTHLANGEIPDTGTTHILTWWYPNHKGMGWHSDGYGGNNGDKDTPVYSFTVGNSCIFEWKPVPPEYQSADIGRDINFHLANESVEIHSGDVIVFGGPQRMMLHRVKKVLLDTEFDFRINITFRHLSDFTDDNKYQTSAYVEGIKKEYEQRNSQ